MFSQIYLAAAGESKITASYALRAEQEPATAASGFAALGLTLAVERITQPHWSRRTKTLITVANVIAGTILAGYVRSHLVENREEIRRVRRIP